MKKWITACLAAMMLAGTVPAGATDAAKQAVYERAVQFVEKGQYDRAISTFEMLGDFLDSKEQIARCQEMIE